MMKGRWTELEHGTHVHTSGAKIVRETYFSDDPRKMPPPGWYALDPDGQPLALGGHSTPSAAKMTVTSACK